MEIRLGEDLRIETEIPILRVIEFSMQWRPNSHAQLQVVGQIDYKLSCNWEKVCESKVKLWREREKGPEILFYGYLKKADRITMANMEEVCLTVESASCKLDIRKGSQSFQDTGRTYSEIEKLVIEANQGQVICTEGKETPIERPVIRYEETVWMFSKRMASHLNTCVVPDIESGKPAFWFGMPKGIQIPEFSDEEYKIWVENHEKTGTSVVYEVKSRGFYKIGDQTAIDGQALVIAEAASNYKQGELTFTYKLKRPVNNEPVIYQKKFAGLGLLGKIMDVQKESVKMALDIDSGKSTGSYYYDWYSETGNVLYAMPEKGAKAVLYFGSADERDAYAVHCLPDVFDERRYTDRCLEMKSKGTINLSAGSLSMIRRKGARLSLDDCMISLGSPKHISIKADHAINLRAKEIFVESSGEIKFYQGE